MVACFPLGNCSQNLFLAGHICQDSVKTFKPWQNSGVTCPTPEIHRQERPHGPYCHHQRQITGDLVVSASRAALVFDLAALDVPSVIRLFTIMSTACKLFKMSHVTD